MIQETIEYALQNWEVILGSVGVLVATANSIARLTPTRKDDAFVEKLRRVLEYIGTLGIPDRVQDMRRVKRK